MPPKSAVASKLQYESMRRATFTDGIRIGNAKTLRYWPHETPSPDEMAELGFYYTPTKTQGDQVTCFWCGKKEKNLEGETSVNDLHLSHSTKCPYALILHYLSAYKQDPDKATFWDRMAEENAPDTVVDPHSDASVQLRLSTFKNLWKFGPRRKTAVTAKGMATAGFFFAPHHPDDDRVMCMYCGCPLSDWDLDDDPWAEHESNSRAFRGNDVHLGCHFLASRPNPGSNGDVVQGYELEHVPSPESKHSRQNTRNTRSKSPESSPLNNSLHRMVDPNLSSSSLLQSPSPSPSPSPSLSPSSLSPNAPNAPVGAATPTDLDGFDISIDQLSDHGTHLDHQERPLRRYPRRKKQAVFPSRIKTQPKPENMAQPPKSARGKSQKSTTSLILEVRDDPTETDHVDGSSHDSTREPVHDSIHDSIHNSIHDSLHDTIHKSAHDSTERSIDETGGLSPIDADLSLPLDADSSILQNDSSSSVSPNSEDEDYSESEEEINSSTEVVGPKVEPKTTSTENKNPRSRFSDDEFGLNASDIAKILNSPKKDRKMKVVRKKIVLPPPEAVYDISDQNLGDYDEHNLSYIERDIQKKHTERTEEEAQKVTLPQPESKPSKMPLLVMGGLSPGSEPPRAAPVDSSLMEIAKPEAYGNSPARETVVIESPEKPPSFREESSQDFDDQEEQNYDISLHDVPQEDTMSAGIVSRDADDQMVPGDASPENFQSAGESSPNKVAEADDDIILDSLSPEKTKSELKVTNSQKVATIYEDGNDKMVTDIKSDADIRKSDGIVQKETRESIGKQVESKTGDFVLHPNSPKVVETPDTKEKSRATSKSSTSSVYLSTSFNLKQDTSEKDISEKDISEKDALDDVSEKTIPAIDEAKSEEAENPDTNHILSLDETTKSESKSNPQQLHRSSEARLSVINNSRSEITSLRTMENGKRVLEDTDENWLAKKPRGEGPLSADDTKKDPQNKEIVSQNTLQHRPDLNTSIHRPPEEQADESPAKEVVISPSSYKEYMSDFAKMGDELGDDSINDTITKEQDEDKRSISSERELTKKSSSDYEAKSPIVGESSEVKDLQDNARQEEVKKSFNQQEKDLSSFIGNSVSEAPELVLASTSPLKSDWIGVAAKSASSDVSMLAESKHLKAPEITSSGREKSSIGVDQASPRTSPRNEETRADEGIPQKNTSTENRSNGGLGSSAGVEGDRISFSGIESSTPVKTHTEDVNLGDGKLPMVSISSVLKEIRELDDAIEYIAGLAGKGYGLHNDADGALTDFISAMPEEEEEMSIEEWIRHNAATCRRIVEEMGDRVIRNYEQEFDRVIDYVNNLDTID